MQKAVRKRLERAGQKLNLGGQKLKKQAKERLKEHNIRKLDKTRKARATVPTGPLYKRQLVPPSQRPELLKYLRQNLFKPDFFENLSGLYGPRVKQLDFHFYINKREHVVPVVIKNTGAFAHIPESQGKNFEEIRRSFEAHQRAVRSGKINPKTYILRSPKVYGRIGDFLVMEFVAKTDLHWDLRKEIFKEVGRNFLRLKDKNLIGKRPVPQTWSLITVANTNPKNPEKGKWVVFLPYDYA